MSRILARDCGFKMVFEYLFQEEFDIEKLYEEVELTDEEKSFSFDVFNAVKTNKNDIDKKIEDNLKNNIKIKDIYKLDYAILLVAIGEIDYLLEPLSLVINEAVELAKKYSTDNSPKFINGVLSTIYKK